SQLNGLGLRLLCQSGIGELLLVEGLDGWDGCAFEVGAEPPVQSVLSGGLSGCPGGGLGCRWRSSEHPWPGSRGGSRGGGLSGCSGGGAGGGVGGSRGGGPGGPGGGLGGPGGGKGG